MGHKPWQRQGLIVVLALLAFAVISGTLISSFHWVNKPFPGFFLHENLTVGPYSLPHWSGGRGGLKPLDVISSADGKPLWSRAELYNRAKKAPAGTSFRYTVVRGSESLQLNIPSVRFSSYDWFLSFGIYVLMGVAFLVIGVAPYYFGANSPAALPLCFMVLAVFVWFETTFDFMTTGVLPKELRIFAVTLTPSAGIHLALLLKMGKPLSRTRPILVIVIYGTAVGLACWNSLTFFGPVDRWIVAFRAGYLYTCVGALAFLTILWSALKRTLPDLARSRLRVMFGGAVLGFLIPTFSTVLTSSFQWSIPYNFALIPTVFFPLSVAFALLKYSLFDLGNALKVALSRVTLTAFLLAMYVAVVVLLGSSVGIYEKDPLIPLLFSVLVVLFFNPLLRWIEGVVDRYIYRQDYDAADVHKEISLHLRTLATAQSLASGFVQLVSQRMSLKSAGLVYQPKNAREVLATEQRDTGLDYGVIAQHVSSLWDPNLVGHYQGISRSQVAGDPRFRDRREELLKVYEDLRCEFFMPIVFEREVRGCAWFGAKRSEREYSAEDLRLLGILTDQLALSLENGRLFEESVKAREEYRSLYQNAELANKQLVENDRVKKHFVANICHELRTPISTIIGYSEVLLDPDFRGDRRAILEKLVNNGQDLSRLMDSLLNFSRMEADALFNRLEPVNVREILRALELMTQRLIRGRPIEFKIGIESDIETIHSDPKKLQEILAQLLTNALKFTERGEIEVKLRTTSEKGRAFLEIVVSDTGIGIDPKDQATIFEAFRQLDGSSTRQYGGTGVGLSLCQKLANALGGKINVNSEVGIGSVFRVLLPLTPADADALQAA
ncbi:MAG: ATP-binding protein [Candidatus Binatia bacterium]